MYTHIYIYIHVHVKLHVYVCMPLHLFKYSTYLILSDLHHVLLNFGAVCGRICWVKLLPRKILLSPGLLAPPPLDLPSFLFSPAALGSGRFDSMIIRSRALFAP